MKTSMKRVICAIFAFCILICAFAACGADTSTSSDSEVNASTQTESSDIVSAVKPDVDPNSKYADSNWNPYATIGADVKGQTVRFATWIDHTTTEGAVPLANFEADTGLKCELVTVAQANYADNMIAKMQSGDYPDVFVSNDSSEAFPLTLQIAQPINKCSTVDLNEPIWDQSMIATATIDGNIFMVNTIGSPWSGSNLIYYNKTLFEENGFTTPEEYYEQGKWTWDTMYKVMRDVKALGDDYYGGSVTPEWLSGSAGVSFVVYDKNTYTFKSGVNDPKLEECYKFYARCREAGLLGGTTSSFEKGKCGILLIGVYGLKSTGYWKDMDPDDVGFTFLPSIDSSTPAKTTSIHRMYGVCAKAPHADAAGYFIRYWLDPDNYDLQNTFLTPQAGQFYYKLINNNAENKYFYFDSACAYLSGQDSVQTFCKGVKSANEQQVRTKLDEVSNKVDTAVNAANDLMKKIRAQWSN